MAIWRVIYFRHYIIMTYVTSVLVDVVFNTPTPCYYADLRIAHNINVVVGSEPLEWIAQPSKAHFCTGMK